MSAADDFRAAVEEGALAAAFETLSDDIVLHSPVTFRPFEGRAAVEAALRAVFEVFDNFRYSAHLGDGDRSALVFHARVGERTLDGIDLIRERDGRIVDLTVLVRPLSALSALAEAMQRKLAP